MPPLADDAGSLSGPLKGVVVADFSRVLAGPYATMLLADMGATVIKIESPTGDETRHWMPPQRAGTSTYFQSINRNKRSIALDLNDPGDAAIAREIVARSDVLVENFMPGTMARLGLDYSAAAAIRPRLVYAALSGFGETAGAALPGYDLLIQAQSGFMSITGPSEGEGYRAGVAVFDVIAGLHLALAIVAGLRHAEKSGEGQRISTNLLAAAISGMVNQTGATVLGGAHPVRMGNSHPSIFPYEPFATSTDPLVVAVGNDGQFERFCTAIGESFASHPDYAKAADRSRNREALRPLIAAALLRRPAQVWSTALREARVPCTVVQDLAAGVQTAVELGLEPISYIGATPTVSNPITFSETPVSYRLAPPDLDEGRADVLTWIADHGIPS